MLGSSQPWMAFRLGNRPPMIWSPVRISHWPLLFFTVSMLLLLLLLTLKDIYITKPFRGYRHASHRGRVTKNSNKACRNS